MRMRNAKCAHSLQNENRGLSNVETAEKPTAKPTRSSSRKKAIVNYKELNEGKQQFLTEGSTEVSAHVAQEAHRTDDMFYEIIDQDDDWTSRGYKEAIAIKMLKPDLNEDKGRCYIPPIYDTLFRTRSYRDTIRPSKYIFPRADSENIRR